MSGGLGVAIRDVWRRYGAVTAVGGVLLATDVTALRERRSRRVAVHASFMPSPSGFVVSGQF